MGKKFVIFGADMSPSVHIFEKKKDILILGEGPPHRLDDTTLAAATKYLIKFVQLGKRFASSLHYNGSNNFLFVNAAKIYQFKAKDSEIKKISLCLGNILGDFSANTMK